MMAANTWVFWTEYKAEAVRTALSAEFEAGRLRQGWGPPDAGLLENGRVVSQAIWSARYSKSIRKNWPAAFVEERRLPAPENIASRYRILIRMIQVKSDDLVVVPRLVRPGGFCITNATTGYEFGAFVDPVTGRSDFGPILNVGTTRVDFADNETEDTELVVKRFPNLRDAITRVADQNYSSLVRSLYESKQQSGVSDAPRVIQVDLQTPERRLVQQLLIDRDDELVRRLKEQYQWSCQICQESIPRSSDKTPYVEVHHVRPLGQPFNGADVPENMLVVCPNCHAALDLGSYGIDPETHLIHTVDGFTRIQPLQVSHEISKESLEFQWNRFNLIRKGTV
jgi:5-methylcytosine-specific restriction endonuclease McrA